MSIKINLFYLYTHIYIYIYIISRCIISKIPIINIHSTNAENIIIIRTILPRCSIIVAFLTNNICGCNIITVLVHGCLLCPPPCFCPIGTNNYLYVINVPCSNGSLSLQPILYIIYCKNYSHPNSIWMFAFRKYSRLTRISTPRIVDLKRKKKLFNKKEFAKIVIYIMKSLE